jgi:hypothetical protein
VIKELTTGRFIADGGERPTPQAARRREDAPSRGVRGEGVRTRAPDHVYDGGQANHDVRQGALREPTRGATQAADTAAAADH